MTGKRYIAISYKIRALCAPYHTRQGLRSVQGPHTAKASALIHELRMKEVSKRAKL
jgi:hypothetical protein